MTEWSQFMNAISRCKLQNIAKLVEYKLLLISQSMVQISHFQIYFYEFKGFLQVH